MIINNLIFFHYYTGIIYLFTAFQRRAVVGFYHGLIDMEF